jgi:hypothetical protein
MVDIPLISKAWKRNKELTEEDAGAIEEAGYQRGVRDMEEDEMGIEGQPPIDDVKYQFWGQNIFGQHTMQGAELSRLVLSSSGTSFHPKEITLAIEIRPYLGRILKMQESIALKWANKLKQNRELYYLGAEPSGKEANIFMELLFLTVYKQDIDNKTRLSYEMSGLKEVNTMRKDIERGEKKPKADEKFGVRA